MSTSLHPRPSLEANSNLRPAKAMRTKQTLMPWPNWNVKLAPLWASSLLAAVQREATDPHPQARNQLQQQPTLMLSILIWTRTRKGMSFGEGNEHFTKSSAHLIHHRLFVFLSSVNLYLVHSPFPVSFSMNCHLSSDFGWFYHNPLHFKP